MYKILVSIDDYAFKYQGRFYARDFIYAVILRYLEGFDFVRIIIRTKEVENSDELGVYNKLIADPRIVLFPVPLFQKSTQLISNYRRLQQTIHQAADGCDAAIFRIPSVLGFWCLNIVKKKHLPFALEVVANPYDISKQTKSLRSWILMRLFHHYQKKACRNAVGVAYVTQTSLQERYPALKKGHFEAVYSSVDLSDSIFAGPRRLPSKTPFILCHVSQSIKTMGKGHQTVINIIKILTDKGYATEAWFAGEGDLITRFEKQTERLGIRDRIKFTGSLNRQQLKEFLTDSDLLVFPSKSEGLPRVILEGYATGLPCLSTPVGGIPEIVPDELLFEPDDANGFANMIIKIMDNPGLYQKLSKQAFETSRNFAPEILQKARLEFFNKLTDTIRAKKIQ